MFSIKVEPTEGESPLNGTQPVLILLPVDSPTVKCEWSLKGACACADGQCEDCLASEEEDDEKDRILTTTLVAAALSLNSLENDETEFHPPIWEDCEAAEETGSASDAASEDVKSVLETIDDNLVEKGPVIEQVNTAEIKGKVNDNGEEIANEEAEMEVEETNQVTVQVVAFPEPTGNESQNFAAINENKEEEEPVTGEVNPEDDSAEPESENVSQMEADDGNPSKTQASCSIAIAANGNDGPHSRGSSFPCGHCSKGFASNQSARRHEAILHHQIERSRLYACSQPDCGRVFVSPAALEMHSLIHSGLRPFTCTTCGVTFNQASSLSRHQGVHSDARPYACAVCSRAFKGKGGLVQHTLTHSALKPFACTVAGCRRAFKDRGTLRKHLHTHSAAKEFTCTVCGGAFGRKDSLTTHTRKFHRF